MQLFFDIRRLHTPEAEAHVGVERASLVEAVLENADMGWVERTCRWDMLEGKLVLEPPCRDGHLALDLI